MAADALLTPIFFCARINPLLAFRNWCLLTHAPSAPGPAPYRESPYREPAVEALETRGEGPPRAELARATAAAAALPAAAVRAAVETEKETDRALQKLALLLPLLAMLQRAPVAAACEADRLKASCMPLSSD